MVPGAPYVPEVVEALIAERDELRAMRSTESQHLMLVVTQPAQRIVELEDIIRSRQ